MAVAAASITNQDTLEQIWLCDTEFCGAESVEEDLTHLPFYSSY